MSAIDMILCYSEVMTAHHLHSSHIPIRYAQITPVHVDTHATPLLCHAYQYLSKEGKLNGV